MTFIFKSTVSSTESQACGQKVFYTPSDRSRNQTLELLTLGKFWGTVTEISAEFSDQLPLIKFSGLSREVQRKSWLEGFKET